MKFTKMQGLGNDYLYVFGTVPRNISDLCRRLSDRHFGVGADGMVFITPSKTADFGMRIFNADGSEATMCGNGIRCVGKYVYDKGYTDKRQLTVETLSGIKRLFLNIRGSKVRTVTVEMGTAAVGVESRLSLGGESVIYTPVSVGNLHAVTFVEDAEAAPLTTLGPLVEKHPVFPGGVNVEFAALIGQNRLRMRVWERGTGETMACGTGACATGVAAMELGKTEREVTVHLLGGDLHIRWDKQNNVYMTGTATEVFRGTYNWEK